MPQLGESVTEGTIGRWLKAVGEPVAQDEPLVEIITDKVNVEVPSPAAGVLTRIAADEGQTVPVGAAIAELDGSDAAPPPRREREEVKAPAPVAAAPAPVAAEGQARTSPLVRRLA